MSDQKKLLHKGNIWKRILLYLKPDLFRFFLSLFFTLVSVILTLYVPILAGRAIDCIVRAGMVDFTGLAHQLTLILICILVTSALQWLTTTINNRITFHAVRNIRNDAFAHLHTLPLSFLDSQTTGATVSKMITDVDTFADGLLLGFSQLLSGVLTIFGTLIFMVTIHPLIALVVVIVTPFSLLVARFIATRTHSMFKEQSEIRAEETALVDEMISGQKLVQSFGKQEALLGEFDEINTRLQSCSLKATFFSSITNPSTRFVNSIVYAAVALSGALIAISGGLSVGSLTSFLSYANQYTKPFNEISGVMTELQNALACAERIFGLIDTTSEVTDPETGNPDRVFDGEIELDNVEFSYDKESELIRDFSLHIDPGMKVAIVGPTGCGKTTIINLIMRFYDIQSGSIRLDGVDTRDIPRSVLRRNIGMVLQDTWLFAGTIRDNICIGKPDATDEEIIAAAKSAHSHSFIRKLPQGYDTVIGEAGGSLSQGQKQLLCITRLMLSPPPVLILDEATSSIDTRTEIRIQKAFARLMKGRTSFIVAHRLSTIQNADRIIVMNKGHILETGTHNELLAKNGFYANLYNSQFEQ